MRDELVAAKVDLAMWNSVGGVINWGQIFGDRPAGRSGQDHAVLCSRPNSCSPDELCRNYKYALR